MNTVIDYYITNNNTPSGNSSVIIVPTLPQVVVSGHVMTWKPELHIACNNSGPCSFFLPWGKG